MSALLLPAAWAEGDVAWHCATHGGPDRPGDLQRDRWRAAMERAEVLEVSPQDRHGSTTCVIGTPRGRRVVSDRWLSLSPDLPPPYFDR